MDEKTLIARRVALELKDGDLVNLGIGLPTFVAAFVPKDADIFFQSENGIIGMLALPEEGLEAEDLTDAGGGPIGALPGAATFDSAMSFGLIRGGHRRCHRAGWPSGRSAGAAGQLDGARPDGAGHGRGDGSGVGGQARHRRDDAHGQR